ncbi:MAG: RHS repeat-associated core domain-containing protein, partial [Tissierellia bacterium]|nr:RHS repeat-associated core domain-containing protein [Tissierellia bacterium]
YHTNIRGDVVSITDSTDTIQAQYTYDPWGTQTSYTGTITQPLRYAGYYFDEETGLYYLKSRYYSPETGRFLTKDAYSYVKNESPQTLNLYVYCGNNPVNLTDPTGTNWISDVGDAIGDWLNNINDDIWSDSESDDSWGDVAWGCCSLNSKSGRKHHCYSMTRQMSIIKCLNG